MKKKNTKQFTIEDLRRVLGYSAAMLTDWLNKGVVAEWGDYGRRMDWSEDCVSLAVRVIKQVIDFLDKDELVRAAELLSDFGFSQSDHTRDLLFDIEDFDDPYEVVKALSVKTAQRMEGTFASCSIRSELQEKVAVEKRKNFAKKYPTLVKGGAR